MKKINIAVVGCGGMSNAWVDYTLKRTDSEIVALVDIRKENAQQIAERYNLQCKIYNDLESVLKDVHIDLIFDVTIPESHKAIVTQALAAGCNVFGEKPMAASMDEAREMVDSASENNLIYAVMQNKRYIKGIRAFRDMISSGVIGSPGFLCADFFVAPHFGGFRDIMESPLLLDMAIHTFDQARFISGADPVSVYCHEFNPAGSWYKGNSSAVCIFELSDGSVFCYRGSWSAEGCLTSWDANWRFNGSKGTGIWDGSGMPYAEIISNSGGSGYDRVDAQPTWLGREGHEGCLDDMFTALLDGKKTETDCTDNIKSMAMVFSALESAKKGQKIKIEY